tara:strand:- start:77 stop:448 length:372 start_codon:yes stop_codon:yes gene_type:complete
MMLRCFSVFLFSLLIWGCTNLDERHVFNYKIEGTAEYVDDIHVVMGPGIDWRANEQVTLPLDISHDIYGNELDYGFEAEHSDSSADVILKVFIDGELVEEKSDFLFDSKTSTYSIKIFGVFKQ